MVTVEKFVTVLSLVKKFTILPVVAVFMQTQQK